MGRGGIRKKRSHLATAGPQPTSEGLQSSTAAHTAKDAAAAAASAGNITGHADDAASSMHDDKAGGSPAVSEGEHAFDVQQAQHVNDKVRVIPRPDDVDPSATGTTIAASASGSATQPVQQDDSVDLIKKNQRPADQGAWATCSAPPADDVAPVESAPVESVPAEPAPTEPAPKKQRTPSPAAAADVGAKRAATGTDTSSMEGKADVASDGAATTDDRQYHALVEKLRTTWRSGRTLPLEWRLAQLGALRQAMETCSDRINKALLEDLGKSEFETYAHEVSQVLQELDYFERNLATLVEQERVMTPLVQMPSMGYILPQPLGVVYLASPWNYPLNLCLVPLVGAIAAGNCVLIKPSHRSKATRQVIKDIVDGFLDTDCFHVLFADSHEEQDAILREKFDYIFFTGSPRVGHVIMEAAAKNLTPMTLELGGKSPVIVDQSAKSALDVAVRRIMWGKLQNCGQTCIAPDYALVHESLVEDFIKSAIECLRAFYGDDVKESKDYGRLIDDKHFDKVEGLLADASTCTIVFGGDRDRASRYFGPTLVTDVQLDSDLMKAEIFGPILPIIPFTAIDEAINFVNERARPLALYVFCQDDATTTRVLSQTTSGGACVNETFVHVGVPGLPFGGVGESGMGQYHGKFSFTTFSHQKAIVRKATFVDPSIRYPPHTTAKTTLLHFMA